MKRELRLWPDAVLKQKAVSVPVDGDTLVLAQDMLDMMYAAEGRGLAAPQVGVLARVFVMDATWKTGPGTPEIFINPEIIWRSADMVASSEGCLSIPGVLAEVARAKEIILRWEMPDGTVAAQKLVGFRAICAQHEVDHLDGIITLDHLTPAARSQAEAVLA